MSDKKLDLILEELQSIKEEQQVIRQEFNDKFKTIERKIDGVHEQVAENAENITAILEDTKHIKNVQDRQEKTIDLLSRRSIDQEAELKRIK
ncbi:hypothetical protein ACFSKI_21520 [Pseudogracilibacillus auburnensis]|uniref:Uncharacterized protein n=1 Tax=Pseudogracilibacillus auburnensis TaxID=1494959 RepID=A0A2V3VK96_9BACI|nr:hypothetical protein [Pseudogracilibacillus auburnensis]MBO1002687.1 hypothetical protein [Pseudogracilibacillus auburnensis]PXW81654.1 hypothetical protein DFR56_12029 [Pseudogracilibacillus auburnensis]